MASGEPTWVPSAEFVAIYSVRRDRLAGRGVEVTGLDSALRAARGFTSIGVVVEGTSMARFVAPDGDELGRVSLPI